MHWFKKAQLSIDKHNGVGMEDGIGSNNLVVKFDTHYIEVERVHVYDEVGMVVVARDGVERVN